MATRSAMGKAKKGNFSNMSFDELLIAYLKAAIPVMGIDPALVEDMCVGEFRLLVLLLVREN